MAHHSIGRSNAKCIGRLTNCRPVAALKNLRSDKVKYLPLPLRETSQTIVRHYALPPVKLYTILIYDCTEEANQRKASIRYDQLFFLGEFCAPARNLV